MLEIFRAPLEGLGLIGTSTGAQQTNAVALTASTFIYGLFGVLLAASGGHAVLTNEWSWHRAAGLTMLVIGVGLLASVALSIVQFFRAQGDQK